MLRNSGNRDRHPIRKRVMSVAVVGILGVGAAGCSAGPQVGKSSKGRNTSIENTRLIPETLPATITFGNAHPGSAEDMKNRKAAVRETAFMIAELALTAGPTLNRTIEERAYKAPSDTDPYVERDITTTTRDHKFIAKVVFFEGVKASEESQQVSSIRLYEYDKDYPNEPNEELYLGGSDYDANSNQYAEWTTLGTGGHPFYELDPEMLKVADGQTSIWASELLKYHYPEFVPPIFDD